MFCEYVTLSAGDNCKVANPYHGHHMPPIKFEKAIIFHTHTLKECAGNTEMDSVC